MKENHWTLRINKRITLLAAALFLVLPMLFIALKSPICDMLARFLTVSDAVQRCDIIFVMGGKAERRVKPAADLFLKGYGKKLVITLGRQDSWGREAEKTLGVRPYDICYIDALMAHEKITPQSYVLLEDSLSTRDDALKLREYYERNKFKSALVMTDPIHSRRSMLCLHWAFKGRAVTFLSCPIPLANFAEGFTHRDDYINYVIEETLRFTFYGMGLKKHE